MNPQKTIFIIIIVLLVAGNVFLGMQYAATQKELREAQNALSAEKINEKTLAFAELFVEKVLKSETEVDFETRLQLENSVRAIGDEEILAQWQRFTETKTEAQAQAEVKTLLGLLVKKIEG